MTGPARRVLIVISSLAACPLACQSAAPPTAPMTSCADSLDGVWLGSGTAPSGEPWRFHMVDQVLPGRETVEAYPMFDDTVPYPGGERDIAYSPGVFDLTRRGTALVGSRTYRAAPDWTLRKKRSAERPRNSVDGVVCTVSHQAAIRSCQDDRIRLAWVPTATIDWPTCTAIPAGQWLTIDLEKQ